MAERNREFGNLLTQGLKSIAARENRGLVALEEEIGYAIGYSRSAIEKWRQGYLPADPEVVEQLARACVRRGGMDRRWLKRFLTRARFPDKGTLVAELFPEGEEALPTVRHNLPRRPYERFIGREKELADLRHFLSPHHRLGVVAISGTGGVGKTALALEVAHRFREEYYSLPPDERFEAIVWVTAKQWELLPAGPAARRPTFTDLDGLYRALAEVLDLPAVIRVATREERDVLVARVLTEKRVLLVLDNFEDVDDPSLMVFLRDLPAPSKAIVTTRHRIDVAVPVHLGLLNEAEARDLICSECEKHRLALAFEEIEKLLRRTGGLPLAIVRTIGRMAWRGSSIEAELRHLGDPTRDIYEFCFERSIALIRGRDAHRLFMALSLFATDASREALGRVAGFGEDILSRDEGLSDLEVLSLVTKEGHRFRLEPMTKVKAFAELRAHPDFERAARQRWIEWHKELAAQAGNSANYPNLRPEAHNLLGVMEWLAEQGHMVEAGWFFRQIADFLFAEGHWEPLLKYAEQVRTWAEEVGDVEMLGTLLHAVTRTVRHHKGGLGQAEEWLERMQITAARLNDERLWAEVWLAQGSLAQKRLPLSEEGFSRNVEFLKKAIDIFRRHAKSEKMIWALNTMGNLHRKHHRFGEARRFYVEGLNVLEKHSDDIPNLNRWRATLRGNLGLIAGAQGRYKEACDLLYEILPDLTEQTDLAEAYEALARYERHLGNIEQAKVLRERANHIVERLGLAPPLSSEDEVWNIEKP